MATQTTTETQTQQDQPRSTPSPDPNHNSGFSTLTPEGYWRRGTQTRHHSESPPRSVFQGEGHTLHSSSAPPDNQKDSDGNEGLDTPNAPRIPAVYLPTPEPTRPRVRNRIPSSRNYDTLADEIRLSENLEQQERLPSLRGSPGIPRSLQEEAMVCEMLTETSDPRSPRSYRTPIPITINNPNNSPHRSPMRLDAATRRNSSGSSNESSIRILGPMRPQDQVNIPSYSGEVQVNFPPPGINHPSNYQAQYEDAMGSALDRSQPAMTTGSSHPRRYATPGEALEDVGEQCRQFGLRLGIRGVETLEMEDQVRAVRALAEAREIDLPIWVASQLREPENDREISRLHSIVRQPDVSLIVPEDPSLPDPWNLTTRRLSSPSVTMQSWQQLEQMRAMEREIWREELAEEVRRNAQLVIEQKESVRELTEEEEEWNNRQIPIRPSNPAIGSRVRIAEPEVEEPRRRVKDPRQARNCGSCSHDQVPRCPAKKEPTLAPEEGTEEVRRDLPPHQTPSQPGLKPGDFRPAGYKYTPFPRNNQAEQNLHKARRRLRDILEDVEGERRGADENEIDPDVSTQGNNQETPSDFIYETPMPSAPLSSISEERPFDDSRTRSNAFRGQSESSNDERFRGNRMSTHRRTNRSQGTSPSRYQDNLDSTTEGKTANMGKFEKETMERIRRWEEKGEKRSNDDGSPSGPPPPPPLHLLPLHLLHPHPHQTKDRPITQTRPEVSRYQSMLKKWLLTLEPRETLKIKAFGTHWRENRNLRFANQTRLTGAIENCGDPSSAIVTGCFRLNPQFTRRSNPA
ncbi:hypothetical protein K435DRAFT_803458 [Dendrothele bispora CBS 962.96]|uniref:Uncharacterized protein n=1 Tax=Dendrothele bispora (strain CBS 962.96) TaxID=1314807 RepID=A0A4S8LHF4_DENBC|nr:hypothetical protein K435DRAFT_803458 [Dendrothele bispora CBS 962.96]